MPEYLAPGVYVEETSFRAKTIEGVSTSTAGFVGPARYGPIDGLPELVTSFAAFERVFSGADPLQFETDPDASVNQLALGVRAFFNNGGRRVYVSRIYDPGSRTVPPPVPSPPTVLPANFASLIGHAWRHIDPPPVSETLLLVARHPGSGGNFRVGFQFRLSENVLATDNIPDIGPIRVLRGVSPFDTLWVQDAATLDLPTSPGTIFLAERFFDDTFKRNNWRLTDALGNQVVLTDGAFTSTQVRRLSVIVEVTFLDQFGAPTRRELWENLTFDPQSPRSLSQVFLSEPESRGLQISLPFMFFNGDISGPLTARVLLQQLEAALPSLAGATSQVRRADQKIFEVTLENGSDGDRPGANTYLGTDTDPKRKTGLRALRDIQDISIIAAPGHTVRPSPMSTTSLGISHAIANHLITHCEDMRYCIAILDSVEGMNLADVRAYRAQHDSTRAAFYYPFVRIFDPASPPDLPAEINLPPSGFLAGIYARNDIEQGVHKSPANEVVRDALGFEVAIDKGQQDILNPEAINCLRYFEGRGYRVWGARTITSDPEWKYINVRRFFLYLERSIDRGTQWVVFQNNGDQLWANVRRTIEDFLFNEWKSGHLFGTKPEEAYFVRCDRTTMTQNDLDNGRLVCLIGVAPLRPAEFVIFRIGQKTADARA
jgi:phage tail sheath protein FI